MPAARATFLSIPLGPGQTARAQLDLTGALPTLSLSVLDGVGGVIASRPPDGVVRGDELSDSTAPQTQITVQGARDPLGFFVGTVGVSLTATDAGSGVVKTYYSLDEGRTWTAYAGPFSADAGQIAVVLGYSVDRAGNAEVVAAKQRLQPLRLWLPLVRR